MYIGSFMYIFTIFSQQRKLVNLHWSMGGSNSHQVPWTLLSILTYHNNAVNWKISIILLVSSSSSLFQVFGDLSKGTNCNEYHCHLSIPKSFFFFSSLALLLVVEFVCLLIHLFVDSFVCLFFCLFVCLLYLLGNLPFLLSTHINLHKKIICTDYIYLYPKKGNWPNHPIYLPQTHRHPTIPSLRKPLPQNCIKSSPLHSNT